MIGFLEPGDASDGFLTCSFEISTGTTVQGQLGRNVDYIQCQFYTNT